MNEHKLPDKDFISNENSNISKSELISHFDELEISFESNEENIGLFTMKNGNRWIEQAKKRPIPNMLFSELWYESELCILFADANLGKSILAVQIANSISSGEPIQGLKLEADKQKVIYMDFELTEKQFEGRYSIKNDNLKIYENHFIWDDNFFRVEINPDISIPDNLSFEQYLNSSLEEIIIASTAKILIIDNLTYLKSETERAKDALPLMKHLKALKSKFNLSILALAHTPKRELSKPITRNDLQGSKMLMNFCDSCFAIGESTKDKSMRYLKQIKQRNTEQVYDADNVLVCQINKPFNFLLFEFVGFGKEGEHLREQTEKDNELLIQKVTEHHKQGKSLREIGKILNISHMKVDRILKTPQ